VNIEQFGFERIDAEPVDLAGKFPFSQFDDKLDLDPFANRRNSKKITNVDDTNAANFQMLTSQIRRFPLYLGTDLL